LYLYGWIFSTDDTLAWVERNGTPSETHYQNGVFEATQTIGEKLQAPSELSIPWAVVVHPANDKDEIGCFFVGTNYSTRDLAKAGNRDRIRRYQRVLELEDVLPSWYEKLNP
jgi:hypothetical protein